MASDRIIADDDRVRNVPGRASRPRSQGRMLGRRQPLGGDVAELAVGGLDLPPGQAGYDAIELAAIPTMADHLTADAGDDYYREGRRRVAGAGLAIESVGATTNLLDPEKRARFERLLRAAAILGAPAITTGPGGVPDGEASFATVARTIGELARVAVDRGVRISIKPHAGQAVATTPTALRLMAEVDPTWVGLNFDASHLYRADEDVVASLTTLAPHLATSRIRDIAGKQPGPGPVENQTIDHEVFYINADDTCSLVETPTLLERYFPEIPLKRPLSGFSSLFSHDKATRLLGYRPRYTWRDSDFRRWPDSQ